MIIALDDAALESLAEQVACRVTAKLIAEQRLLPAERHTVTETEAARLAGLTPGQLKAERFAGRINASVGPNREIVYASEDLNKYLAARGAGKELP